MSDIANVPAGSRAVVLFYSRIKILWYCIDLTQNSIRLIELSQINPDNRKSAPVSAIANSLLGEDKLCPADMREKLIVIPLKWIFRERLESLVSLILCFSK